VGWVNSTRSRETLPTAICISKAKLQTWQRTASRYTEVKHTNYLRKTFLDHFNSAVATVFPSTFFARVKARTEILPEPWLA
jgi:hypothetical protein